MPKTEIRHGIYLARADQDRTLTFLVCVEIEPNSVTKGEFVATVRHLEEGTIIVAGESPDEACENALSLFREMVDHCLVNDSLAEFLGDADIMNEIAV